MVRRRQLLFLIIVGLFVFSLVNFSAAQSIEYSVDHQWCQIFINQDGTIDLKYNVTLTVTSGKINGFYVGQPNSDFTPGIALDQNNNLLDVFDASSGSDYKIDVILYEPLTAGNSLWFTVTTNVAGMIFNDTTNPGNLGLRFAPQWISDKTINDVRVQIILPEGVSSGDYATENLPNGTSTVEGRLALYWEKAYLEPNERFFFGVSFPAEFMPDYKPSEDSFEGLAVVIAGVVAFLFATFSFIFVLSRVGKNKYASPKISMETLGIKRGLTAIEAAYLLDLKPQQIITATLYSLLHKRAVWVEKPNPAVKIKLLPPYEDKIGTKENPLRYYEIDFLNSLKTDGTLNEEKLARTIMTLRDTVEKKIEGYSRKETVEYYRKIVDKAWKQVELAGTPELASNAYDEQLLWLMLDPNQRQRTTTVFQDKVFQPNPLWYWWWYGYGTYHPHPTYKPDVKAPTQSSKPPVIPGAEFADNIATSIETTANSIVANIEKFANSIVPPPPKVSHQPARKGSSCVCACAACACACACVSCACACAGGGAH